MDRRFFVRSSAAAAFAGPALVHDQGLPGLASRSEVFLMAVRDGRLDDVRRLLDADRSLAGARDAEGRSAFVLAHLHGHPAVADHLMSRGLHLDLVESILAREWDRFEALASVAPGAVNLDHPIGGTAMYAAAWTGLGSNMWRVAQYDGDPNGNPRGAKGFTPVRAAVEHPDTRVMHQTLAALVGNGGDANAPQRDGDSPLHAVAARGDATMVRHLIRKGADPEAQDVRGRTPMAVAEEGGFGDVAELLRWPDRIARDHRSSRFAYGADGTPYLPPQLEVYDSRLRNRMVGSSHFDLDTVRSLHEQVPALVHAVNYGDEAAVEACAHTGRRPVADFLLERGAPYSLPTAVMMGDVSTARRLLTEDPLRVHERGAHDFALTWYPAIGGDQVDLMELLVDAGAPIEQEFLGTTALHFAARGGHVQLTRYLIDIGADVNAVGHKFTWEGETPLDHAVEREHAEIERLLVAAGATRQR